MKIPLKERSANLRKSYNVEDINEWMTRSRMAKDRIVRISGEKL